MTQAKIKIISSGKYIPKDVITNQDLEKLVDTNHEWIVSRTGIIRRHKARDEETSDMAYLAAKDALDKSKYNIEDIDLIIVASITGDQMTPSVANFVQKKLGIKHDCMSFDINAACTGFVYGLEVASMMLSSGKFKAAIVIGAEKLTRITNYEDRNTCVLFGDGAGALLIEPSEEENRQAYFYNAAKIDETDALTVVKHIKMDGRKVFLFAVDIMQKSIQKVLKDANLTIDQIDRIIPHQANMRIIQSVSKAMDIPMEKFKINLEEYGNTSAASIPIALDEYMSEENQENKKIILVGFGGGFTYGSALFSL
ncbi:beta-ketoacyl-ACP synthase III [Mariniplasma anaerobium]|uniref:Beta-ketoacyl-[acyl-carrier-protein] synthase III n=1 Tax=Mariniplasma anaerobium TaxID=2735436 RepID=A0A7U9TGY6_9MOLU|nr:beta-ketoacyl-ACP synthase III [Mariniplasma anaerobium]BCR36302.1 3-oxoacyl-[acyl-carrier-protein] synthase 3 [Mariniplasma anaerobium]